MCRSCRETERNSAATWRRRWGRRGRREMGRVRSGEKGSLVLFPVSLPRGLALPFLPLAITRPNVFSSRLKSDSDELCGCGRKEDDSCSSDASYEREGREYKMCFPLDDSYFRLPISRNHIAGLCLGMGRHTRNNPALLSVARRII